MEIVCAFELLISNNINLKIFSMKSFFRSALMFALPMFFVACEPSDNDSYVGDTKGGRAFFISLTQAIGKVITLH